MTRPQRRRESSEGSTCGGRGRRVRQQHPERSTKRDTIARWFDIGSRSRDDRAGPRERSWLGNHRLIWRPRETRRTATRLPGVEWPFAFTRRPGGASPRVFPCPNSTPSPHHKQILPPRSCHARTGRLRSVSNWSRRFASAGGLWPGTRYDSATMTTSRSRGSPTGSPA